MTKEVFNIKIFFLQKKIHALGKKLKFSPLLILSGLSFALAIFLLNYPHKIFQTQKYQIPRVVRRINNLKLTDTPIETLSPVVISKHRVQVLPTIQSITNSQPINSHQTTSQIQASTSTEAQPTQASIQKPAQTVNLQIIDPDGTSSFSVILISGNNLCDTLTEAKNEGKIKSVTMIWYPNFNSYYVVEINGFNNNWTTALNGVQPRIGCSLIKPKPSDNIVWKFG